MDAREAIKICERWFTHIELEKTKATVLQKAASAARRGDKLEAMRLKSQVDRSPTVYDAATLLPAVKYLAKTIKESSQ